MHDVDPFADLFAPVFVDDASSMGPAFEGFKQTFIGNLRLPTGRLVARDPFSNFDDQVPPVPITLQPGEYPIFTWGDAQVHCAVLRVAPGTPESWDMVEYPPPYQEEDEDGFFSGIPVDAGFASFMDLSVDHALYTLDEAALDTLHDQWRNLWERTNTYDLAVELDPPEQGNLVMCASGFGDGQYPVFIGRNQDEEVVAVLINFLISDDDEEDEEA